MFRRMAAEVRAWSRLPEASVTLFTAAVCLVITLVVAGHTLQARLQGEHEAADRAGRAARGYGQHIVTVIAVSDAILEGLVGRLEEEPPLGHDHLRRVLEGFGKVSGQIEAILVFDADGNLVANNRPHEIRSLDARRREFYLFHRSVPGAEHHISATQRSPATGKWLIPISRRIDRGPEGRFDGMVVATVAVDALAPIYKAPRAWPRSEVILARDDGTVLMSSGDWLSAIGRDVSPLIARAAPGGPPVTFRARSPFDNQVRFYGVQKPAGSGVALVYGISAADLFASFVRDVCMEWIMGVATVGVVMTFGLRLAAQLKRRRKAEAEVRRLAQSDVLTGLANRAVFQERLDALLLSRRAADREFALFAIDLDRFKAVNDTYGHGMGDKLLRAAAERLGELLREGDVLARLGGDEFSALICGGVGRDDLALLAGRMVEALHAPFEIDGRVLEIGASIGIARFPLDGAADERLSSAADLALYRAKAEGRGGFRFFEADMDATVRARRKLEGALRRATAVSAFELNYQPQLRDGGRAFSGAEALIRWKDDERGWVSPDQFIPLAEESGLIGAIGEWVLGEACAEAARWASPLKVAVNFSPAQFRDPGLAGMIEDKLTETGLCPKRLEVEVIESVLLQDETQVMQTLARLRLMGVSVSLDDFGTGYSSLSYLRRFQFDRIKIDKSFVQRLPDDRHSVSIIRAVLSLCADLGIGVTAEGVETEAQRRFVVEQGCDELQGFLFSPPVSAKAWAAMRGRAPALAAAPALT